MNSKWIQWILGVLVTLSLALGGYVLGRLDKVAEAVQNQHTLTFEKFVPRDDYDRDLERIERRLERLDEKLDRLLKMEASK